MSTETIKAIDVLLALKNRIAKRYDCLDFRLGVCDARFGETQVVEGVTRTYVQFKYTEGWSDIALMLFDEHGYIIDTKSYSTLALGVLARFCGKKMEDFSSLPIHQG